MSKKVNEVLKRMRKDPRVRKWFLLLTEVKYSRISPATLLLVLVVMFLVVFVVSWGIVRVLTLG